jgi:hypothetical protein
VLRHQLASQLRVLRAVLIEQAQVEPGTGETAEHPS